MIPAHRRKVALGALLALLLAAAAWFIGRQPPSAQPSSSTPAAPVSVVDGLTVVQVPPAVQRRSGLVVQPVGVAADAGSGNTAYGVVLDVQPLIDWQGRYVAAAAQAQAAHAQWAVAQAELARTRKLHEDDQNMSLKALQAAQAEEERARAAATGADASVRTLQSDGLQQFGPVLTGWAADRSGPMQKLLVHKEVLVGIAPGAAGAAPPKSVQVSLPNGPRWTARWVGPAAQADVRLGSVLQTYLVAAPLPTNAGVVAFLPDGGGGGVLVPLGAVVWYADQPWAYVRRDTSHFVRTPLLQASETADGYVARGGIAAGAAVVTQGAGLLLSQEQTPPPGAPRCKDPECD